MLPYSISLSFQYRVKRKLNCLCTVIRMVYLLHMSLYHDSIADFLYIGKKVTKALETWGILTNWMQNTQWVPILTGYFKVMTGDFLTCNEQTQVFVCSALEVRSVNHKLIRQNSKIKQNFSENQNVSKKVKILRKTLAFFFQFHWCP